PGATTPRTAGSGKVTPAPTGACTTSIPSPPPAVSHDSGVSAPAVVLMVLVALLAGVALGWFVTRHRRREGTTETIVVGRPDDDRQKLVDELIYLRDHLTNRALANRVG